MSRDDRLAAAFRAGGRGRRRLAAAVAAIVLLAAAGGVGWWRLRVRAPLARLAAATPGHRTTPVRLAHAPYAPFDPARELDATDRRALAGLAAALEKEVARSPRADRCHALGLARLFLGDGPGAIAALRRAVDLGGGAAAAADLGAALVADGLRRDSPHRLAEGLEVLASLGSGASSARFNEALALEALGLREAAQESWQAQVRREPTSPWSREARARLASSDRSVSPRPGGEPARATATGATAEALERRVLEELLPQWAAAGGGSAAAAAALEQARAAAGEHRRRFADPLLPAVLDWLERSARDRPGLATDAVRAYARARAAYARQDLGACDQEVERARGILAALPESDLATLVEVTGASCGYLASDLDRTWERLGELRPRLRRAPAPSALVGAQVEWLRGLVAHMSGRPLAALDGYERALATFERHGDAARAARMHGLLGELLQYLGRAPGAWGHAAAALRGPLGPSGRYQALGTLVRLAGDGGMPNVAVRVAKVAVAEASRMGSVEYVTDAHLVLAGAQLAAGDPDTAIAGFRRAEALARTIPQPERARHLSAFARVELAQAIVARDPAEAAGLLRQAELESTGELVITAALVEAEAARRRGDSGTAETILRAAGERSRRERGDFADLRARDQLFARREAVHVALVRLLVEAGRSAEALETLEGWRAESLVDDGAAAAGPVIPRLAVPGTTFVSFLALADELWVWRVARGAVTFTRHPVTRDALVELVGSVGAALRRGDPAPDAERLAGLLLGAAAAPVGHRLVLAPDAVTFSVPFAALPQPGGGRLIDRHEVALVPALAGWLDRRETAPAPSRCALVVRGAADGGTVVPGLSRLRRLDDEATAVAAGYPCARRAVTVAETRDEVGRSPAVVHYAGHAVAVGAGGVSLLLGEPRVETIETPEISRWRLAGATVVLGACAGADGRPSALAGRDGLARAFLGTGARAVVANLWPVGDDDAYELAVELHRRLAAGAAPGAALREAQRALAGRGRPVSAWGGWVLLGRG